MAFHQRINKPGIACAVLLLCAAFTAASCTDNQSGQASPKTPKALVTLEGRPEHFGGDQLSWLNTGGDTANSSFCDARLKLPLATEPSWEHSYTDAVFSSWPYNDIVHFDGVLAVSAYTSQLMGLDAATGELLFNKDVYYVSGHPDRLTRIQSLFFNPLGLLSARDDPGRVYCWEPIDGGVTELWVHQGKGGIGGIVADSEFFFAGGRNQVNGISATTGEVEVELPTLFSNTPIIMSRSGTIICWPNSRNKMIAFDGRSAHTKWITFFDEAITSAVIADGQGCIYVTTIDETLYCLDLQTGEQRWDYSWMWLLDQETRQERATLLGIPETSILPIQPIAGPWGFCLTLASGDVLLFTHSGELQWKFQADSSIGGAIGLTNAILVELFWEPTDEFSQPELVPFNLIQPDWHEINARIKAGSGNSEDGAEAEVTLGKFARIIALDISSGKELDSFEPEEYTYGSFIPAYNNIILTKVKGERQSGSRRGLPKWIVAYNWLEEGSK